MIYYYLAVILALTLLFASLYRTKVLAVCPICAGVVLTWVGGIVAIYANVSWANPLIIAILMGSSLGALAEKYGSKFGLIWKSAVVILGLLAIYSIVQGSILLGIVLLALIAILTYLTKPKSKAESNHQHDLFKNCC